MAELRRLSNVSLAVSLPPAILTEARRLLNQAAGFVDGEVPLGVEVQTSLKDAHFRLSMGRSIVFDVLLDLSTGEWTLRPVDTTCPPPDGDGDGVLDKDACPAHQPDPSTSLGECRRLVEQWKEEQWQRFFPRFAKTPDFHIPIKPMRPTAQTPAYQTAGAAGLDLHWCPPRITPDQTVIVIDGLVLHVQDDLTFQFKDDALVGLVIDSGRTAILHTGISLAIPEGYEGQVRARSSYARQGVIVQGTIDADYRGEVMVILHNAGPRLVIKPGQRIAQLVVAPVARVVLEQVEELPQTVRGEGGLGSTGR